MKRRSRKVKNFILWTITFVAAVLYMFSCIMVGTGAAEYTALLLVSMAWLGLFALANGLLKVLGVNGYGK